MLISGSSFTSLSPSSFLVSFFTAAAAGGSFSGAGLSSTAFPPVLLSTILTVSAAFSTTLGPLTTTVSVLESTLTSPTPAIIYSKIHQIKD